LKGVGDRAIYAGQLASGDVDIAPEYVSSMTEYLNREINGADAEPVATPDVDETMTQLEELAGQKNMTPLEPAEAEDANAFAVTKQFSEENDVTSLSDLGELGEPVALAAAPDCPDRPDCKLGLEDVYGIDISEFEPLGFGSPQTKDALTSGEVQLGQVGTSDGQIEQLELVVLEDDQNWQNAENLVPVVSTEFLDANPEVADILNSLSDVLTTEDLMTLNAQVDAERQLAADVAEQYLSEKGLEQEQEGLVLQRRIHRPGPRCSPWQASREAAALASRAGVRQHARYPRRGGTHAGGLMSTNLNVTRYLPERFQRRWQ
jgi:osmoprotectant transport system substrate-binding protein